MSPQAIEYSMPHRPLVADLALLTSVIAGMDWSARSEMSGSGLGGLLVVCPIYQPSRPLSTADRWQRFVLSNRRRIFMGLPEPSARLRVPVTVERSTVIWKDRLFSQLLISKIAFPICGFMLAIALPVYLPQAIMLLFGC